MENDVLRNKIAPWQEKGRWYHGVVNVPNRTLVADKTDQFLIDHTTSIIQTQSNLVLDLDDINLKCIDSKFIMLDDYRRSDSTYIYNIGYGRTTGETSVSIGYAGSAGHSEFWVFIVKI